MTCKHSVDSYNSTAELSKGQTPSSLTFFYVTLYSQSDVRDDRVESERKSSDRLTLQDLQIPDGPSQSACVYQERPLSGTAERRAIAGSLSSSSSSSRVRSKIVRQI